MASQNASSDIDRALKSAILFATIVAIGLGFVISAQVSSPAKRKTAPARRALVRLPEGQFVHRTLASNFRRDSLTQDLTLPCQTLSGEETTLKIASQTERIRLIARNCNATAKKDEFQILSIQNLANSYTATVFSPRPEQFLTDYISLESLDNSIQLRIQRSPGDVKEFRLTLARQTP